MNSSLWSENILNLATFLTSIVSLFTLNELRKQRYLANSPKLHITSKKNIISATNKRVWYVEKELPLMWESKFLDGMKDELLEEIDNDYPPMYSIPLNLINIGSTPALNVRIAWNYDNEGRESIKNIINKFNELDLGVKCEIPDDTYNDSLHVTRQSATDDKLMILGKKIKRYISMELMPLNIEYLLPFSESNRGTQILIPYPYTSIIALELSVLSLSEISLSENHHDYSFPTLYADVSYYDNINILHKEKLSVKSVINEAQWQFNKCMCEKKLDFINFTIETHKINGNKMNDNGHFETTVQLSKESKLKD